MKKSHARGLVATAATVGLLAACGGGGDDAVPPSSGFVVGTDNMVPIGVEQNIADVVAFAKAQIAATSDTTDPVLLADVKLATDDTAEPADI